MVSFQAYTTEIDKEGDSHQEIWIVIEAYDSTKDTIAGLVLHVLNEAKNASVSFSVASSNADAGDF